MYTISKTFSFCYGHRLLGDAGKCKNLHGHSAKATVFISTSGLDSLGMVCHFDKLKQSIGKWISDNLDHTMLLSKADSIAKLLKNENEKIFLMDKNPTAENIAKLIYDKSIDLEINIQKVEVWESETARAIYCK